MVQAETDLRTLLSARKPAIAFDSLTRDQQEILLDFAHTETAVGLGADLLNAVLARDWQRLIRTHLYVRYAGPAPDHARNKAFADRWVYSGKLGVTP